MRHQTAEGLEVLEKSLLINLGIGLQARPGLLDPCDDLVFHIGHVHDVVHLVITEPQISPEDIAQHEGAKVADMGKIMNRWTTAVHPNLPAIGLQRLEWLHASGQGVE